jgi:2,4-dienoyl-CoA reductase-like NADH-dependent reductase (Old Yellow Enzyme family)
VSISIRGVSICSPFFLAPINTGFGVAATPDVRLIRFHAERSGRNIGVSYVGNVAIGQHYISNPQTLVLASSVKPWRELVRTIRANGSIAGIQLACKLPSASPTRKWRSSREGIASFIERANREIGSLSESDLAALCELFVSASSRAIDSGFEIVQIHAAHGYFLSQLMNPTTNSRKDKYSATENFALEMIIDRIRRVNPSAVIDIRVSLFDGLDELESEMEFRRKQIVKMIEAGADIISLTAGMYEVDRFSIYPNVQSGHALHLAAGIEMASVHAGTFWNIAGNIWDISSLGWELYPNLTYGIGRALIADPSFVQKSIDGQVPQIQKCIRSGHCHYYSRGRPNIECKVNDRI